VQQRLEANASAHKEATDALGSIELVSRERHGVDSQLAHIDVDLADGLYAIDVKVNQG